MTTISDVLSFCHAEFTLVEWPLGLSHYPIGDFGMSEPPQKTFGYPTTRWTDVLDVIQKGGDEASFTALGELFQLYRPAIRAFFARCNPNRADDLTSDFFESCVIVPWNRRHGRLSPLYSTNDIRRFETFSQALRERKRPVTEYLWGVLDGSTRETLESDILDKNSADELRAKLIFDLNAVIQGPCIYEKNRFADVDLSVESRNLLGRESSGHWTIWLNRSLLADAFPSQLTKGIGFLYLVERLEQTKFRTYLAHVLWWFLRDTTKADLTEFPEGFPSIGSLDELEEMGLEVSDGKQGGFGRVLDEEFARRLFALASGQFSHSTQYEAHLRGRITQKQAAEQIGMSENAFRQGYFRYRQRLSGALHDEVSRLVGPDENQIHSELNYLMTCLAD